MGHLGICTDMQNVENITLPNGYYPLSLTLTLCDESTRDLELRATSDGTGAYLVMKADGIVLEHEELALIAALGEWLYKAFGQVSGESLKAPAPGVNDPARAGIQPIDLKAGIS